MIQKVDPMWATTPSALNDHIERNIPIICLWEDKSANAEEPLGFDQG